MFDVVEGGGGGLAVDDFDAQGLEGALPEVDAPDAGLRYGHRNLVPECSFSDASEKRYGFDTSPKRR